MVVNMTKISLFGSLGLLVFAVLVSFYIDTGIKGIFIIIAIIAILYLDFRFVPAKWSYTILFISFIVLIQYTFQSWLYSISLVILLLAYVLFRNLNISHRWKWAALLLFYIVMIVGTVNYSEYMPKIEQQVLDQVSEEISEDRRVINASIELDENRVQCVLVTENAVLEEEQKEIGESCAKKISDNVEMKAKRFHETNADVGELYNYYGLYLNLIVSEKGESLQGVKSSSNEEVEWSKVTY